MPKPSVDYLAILRTLRRHKVDFIIVGGVCAVLHGAPLATFDLDVVHSRELRNLARLRAALEPLQRLAVWVNVWRRCLRTVSRAMLLSGHSSSRATNSVTSKYQRTIACAGRPMPSIWP